MGTIAKQTLIGTLFSYLGVLVGGFYTVFIFPKYLTTSQIGLVNLLSSYGSLFAQLASLGFGAVASRFFTTFQNQKAQHNGFLSLYILIGLIGFALVSLLILFSKEFIFKEPENQIYTLWLIPLIFFILFFTIFDNYFALAAHKAAIGTMLKELFQRLLILAAIALLAFNFIDFQEFLILYIFTFVVITFVLMYFIYKSKQLFLIKRINISIKYKTEFIQTAFWGIVAGLSSNVIIYIDKIMLEKYINSSATGIYATLSFFAVLINMPTRSLNKIAVGIVSEAYKQKNIKKVASIYKKSSINQLILGSFVLLLLWLNIDEILKLLPEKYAEGRYVILFLGLGYLFDMATGINTVIIGVSEHYRYNTYFIVVLIFLMLLFNSIFIPHYALNGAAIATALAFLIINLVRSLFIYKQYGIHPFDKQHLLIVLLTLIVYLTVYVLGIDFHNLYISIIIKSFVITMLFGLPVYFLRLSSVDEFIKGKF